MFQVVLKTVEKYCDWRIRFVGVTKRPIKAVIYFYIFTFKFYEYIIVLPIINNLVNLHIAGPSNICKQF
jgi:hypothetical protein